VCVCVTVHVCVSALGDDTLSKQKKLLISNWPKGAAAL
jgi:hypothetical protein